MTAPPPRSVAFLLKGYPRLSETFIAQEIRGLERLGLDIHIYSLRPPRERERHPVHAEIMAPVVYLPERLRDQPARVAQALLRTLVSVRGGVALATLLADLLRAPSLDLLRRFGQGAVLAHELPESVERIHAHFLHTPASVARFASILSGRPWSCSAHARDIWTIGPAETRAKLRHMAWLVTCTGAGHRHLAEIADDPAKVHLVYHGLDFERFPPFRDRAPGSDGRPGAAPVALLSVGRAVEKKGFDVLLDALAQIGRRLDWHWTHIGAGERLADLQAAAARLGLTDRITWLGARSQQEVLAAYRRADLFVLPSRIAADGDRDGLPNVLVEAQSQGLAVLSTTTSGIPELVTDGVSGRLVAPGDPAALAAALAELMSDPAKRMALGAAGAAVVRERFSADTGLARLAALFDITPHAPSSASARATLAAGE